MEIKNLRLYSGNSSLKAFFDLETPKLTIKGCKLLTGKDGNLYAAMPSREYTHNGQKKWDNIVWIHDEELMRQIHILAREAYELVAQPKQSPSENEDLPF